MKTLQIKVKSWNRFLTRNLAVTPEVLGKEHHFSFANSTVSIKLPTIDQVDRGSGYDEIVSVGARRAVDNEPIEFDIHKVDVEVLIPITISVPVEVFNQPPNAYKLFSEEEQKRLSDIAWQHQSIAVKAFEYWIRVTRWICNDSRIGRNRVENFQSGWGTYLLDAESASKIWTPGQALHVTGYKTLELKEWEEIQLRLSLGSQPPIYVELKHDAEEHIRLGDYRRSLIDMAIACETFLRFAILQRLPRELNPRLTTYIEEANITPYYEKFFPEIIDEATKKKFKKLKEPLHKLFDRRNKLVHMGKDDGIDKELCLKILKLTEELFSIITDKP